MKRIIGLILCAMMLFAGCAPSDMQYYADRNNYVTVTATASHIAYDEEAAALYIGIDECRKWVTKSPSPPRPVI